MYLLHCKGIIIARVRLIIIVININCYILFTSLVSIFMCFSNLGGRIYFFFRAKNPVSAFSIPTLNNIWV